MSHRHIVTQSPRHFLNSSLKKTIIHLTSLFILLILLSQTAYSQVAINTTGNNPDASAILDISSTEKGMLAPRMHTTERTAISSPANGLLVYDTDTRSLWHYESDYNEWVEVLSSNISLSNLSDAISNSEHLYLGYNAGRDMNGWNWSTGVGPNALKYNISGWENVALGNNSLINNLSGNYNTGIGNNSLGNNETGSYNTAIGKTAGYGVSGSSFSGCVFLGYQAGKNNSSDNKLYIENSDSDTPLIGGDFSTDQVDINGTIKITGGTPGNGKVLTSDADGLASWEDSPGATELNDLSDAITDGNSLYIGTDSGLSNSGTDNKNTSVGYHALSDVTTGYSNTALGYHSLSGNTTGKWNTVIGSSSAESSNGDDNTVIGALSLGSNTSGSRNIAIGNNVLNNNSTGSWNIAIGYRALMYNSTGHSNTALGYYAGYGSSDNSFSGCIFLGNEAGKNNTSDNKLYIDNSSTSSPLIGGDFSTNQVDINGTIKITGGTPGNDKVLTSDADGLASWEDSPGATELNDLSDAINDGNSLYIGTNSGLSNSGTNNMNTSVGYQALSDVTTGYSNTALGYLSLSGNIDGKWNTVIGSGSATNSNGDYNTVVGASNFSSNTTGSCNIAIGNNVLNYNSTGSFNTAIGRQALMYTSTGDNNTALGYYAGRGSSDNSFSGCIFLGNEAGRNNTSDNKLYIDNSSTSSPLIGGDFSTNQVDINGTIKITGGTPGNDKVLTSDADGLASWEDNTAAYEINDLSDAIYNGSDLFLGNGAGNSNSGNNSGVALGKNALTANTTSNFNTAIGFSSLDENTGERNTAVGSYSLGANTSGQHNTSIGYSSGISSVSGSNNTFIGYRTQMNNNTTKNNSTAIGNEAVITASNQVRIGNPDVTSIGGQVAWSTLSDGRFKENIKEDVAGLDFVLNLRPVSYTVNKQAFNAYIGSEYKSNNHSASQRECGFVAQEVEELIQKTGVEFNGVDAPENSDDYYGIRYSQFVVPLVKSVQELNEKLEKENTEQTTEIENLQEENDALKARLEKLEEILLKK